MTGARRIPVLLAILVLSAACGASTRAQPSSPTPATSAPTTTGVRLSPSSRPPGKPPRHVTAPADSVADVDVLSADQVPTDVDVTGWTPVSATRDTLACQPPGSDLHAVQTKDADFSAPRANLDTTVLRFARARGAEAAYARALRWISTCRHPDPYIVDRSGLHAGRATTGSTRGRDHMTSRVWAYPVIKHPTRPLWDDMSIARRGEHLVLTSISRESVAEPSDLRILGTTSTRATAGAVTEHWLQHIARTVRIDRDLSPFDDGVPRQTRQTGMVYNHDVLCSPPLHTVPPPGPDALDVVRVVDMGTPYEVRGLMVYANAHEARRAFDQERRFALSCPRVQPHRHLDVRRSGDAHLLLVAVGHYKGPLAEWYRTIRVGNAVLDTYAYNRDRAGLRLEHDLEAEGRSVLEAERSMCVFARHGC